MEYLHNGFTLDFSPGSFPLSTDSVALAGFVRLGAKTKVLDLGSGCGSLGMLLCARWADCSVTGMELDPAAHEMALKNARANNLSHRLNSICADLNNINDLVPAGSFSCCVSNPPYFSAGPASKLTLARREDACSMEDLFRSAAWALKYGGDFYLVHKPERLAQLCACAAACNLEPKRLQLLRHKEGGPVSLILVQCRKGGKPGLIFQEEALFDASNKPTAYYQNLYHL